MTVRPGQMCYEKLFAKATVTTTIRLRFETVARLLFDCSSTALRPFDDLRRDLTAALLTR